MFFTLSKTLGLLTVPSNALTLLALGGAILLLTRWRRAGHRILLVCVAVFFVVGCMPIGSALYVVLEDRFPAWSGNGPVDGIVILGGPISPDLTEFRGQISLGSDAERLTEIPNLARRFPAARIVYSGGYARLFGAGTPEAVYGIQLLESLGIPRQRLIAEERSRNTEENAVFTKALIDPKPGERWLLVTSALHMPRAVGVFRKAGFPVEPYPVDWHTSGRPQPWWRWLMPRLSPVGGWAGFDDASKEWVGLLMYRLTGRSSELFPAPTPAPNPAAAIPADRRP